MASLEERIAALEEKMSAEPTQELGVDALSSLIQRLGEVEDAIAKLRSDVGASIGVRL